MTGGLRRNLRSLARREQGMALPTALFALIAAFALGTAAILSSVDVQQGERGDMGRKDSIAAADAGANVALLRLNRFQDKLTEATPCVGPAGEAQTPTGGWCPATPVESLNKGASFTYQVSAFNKFGSIKVISIGTAAGESRRVEVGLFSLNGQKIFGDEHLIGKENIEFKGNPTIDTDIGTNGNVEGIGNPHLCGNIRHGIGKEAPEPECHGEIYEGEKELPPVTLPEDAGIANCRLTDTCPLGEKDPFIASNGREERTSKEPFESKTRDINVGSNKTLTMGGTDYLACSLSLGANASLIMAATTHVRIYIDTPENCGLSAGANQVDINGTAQIQSTGNVEGEQHVLEIFVLGSPTIPTDVLLSGTSSSIKDEVIIYAPYSEITVQGNAEFVGMLAGKKLNVHGNPTFTAAEGVEQPNETIQSLWERTHYVECTGATASPPDANC